MKSKRISFSISGFFRSFKNLRAINNLSADQRNIVFYSESGQDWHHFEKIIAKLLKMSKIVCYITSDSKDPGLDLQKPALSFFLHSRRFLADFSFSIP